MARRDITATATFVPLLGAAILAGVSLAGLPWGPDLLRRPRTPFDRSLASSVAPGYALLSAAAGAIPRGATVVVLTEPRDPIAETYYHRFADALLPGRRALPASFYGHFAPDWVWRDAAYVVVVGKPPAKPPGRLLVQTPEGSAWEAKGAAP